MQRRQRGRQRQRHQPAAPTGRQRQNTLSPRSPQAAFSYHAQRAERNEAPGRQPLSATQERNKLLSTSFWLRRSGSLVAVVVALICLISIVSLSTQPRIVLLGTTTSGKTFHDTATYQAAAAGYFASSLLNRNKITVDTGAVSRRLKQQFPELASVSVSLPLIGHRPIVYLQANQPAFVLQTINGTFVLDTSGKVLLSAAATTPGATDKLPVITDQSGLHAKVGKQVISSAEAGFMQTVTATLAAKQISVQALVLPVNTAQELDVRPAGQAYVVKFNMHDPTSVRQQVGTYLATINSLQGQGKTPAQYIDVRVLGRAYYQ